MRDSKDRFENDERKRWGNWLMGVALALGVVAALSDNDGQSSLWPPVLATAFAVAFAAYVADAYRSGVAQGRFGESDRTKEPTSFNSTVLTYGVFAVLCALMALGFLWDLLDTVRR